MSLKHIKCIFFTISTSFGTISSLGIFYSNRTFSNQTIYCEFLHVLVMRTERSGPVAICTLITGEPNLITELHALCLSKFRLEYHRKGLDGLCDVEGHQSNCNMCFRLRRIGVTCLKAHWQGNITIRFLWYCIIIWPYSRTLFIHS